MLKNIYKIGVVFLFTATWALMIVAKKAEYDVNYVLAIYAFLLSLLGVIIIGVGWFKKRGVVKINKILTVAFLISSSPISIILFVYLYGQLIGQYFKF
jgi:uncharacterized membrane protein (Fun14 family)